MSTIATSNSLTSAKLLHVSTVYCILWPDREGIQHNIYFHGTTATVSYWTICTMHLITHLY
jgi:hypothetical protein